MTPAVRRLATNAVANYAGQIVTLVAGVLLTPLLIAHLGTPLYGVLVLVSSIQGLGGTLDLGLTSSVVKYVAEHQARGETEETSRVVSSSLLLHLALGGLALLLTIAGAIWGMPLLHLTSDQLPVARAALLVAGVTLAFRLPLGMLASLLVALRRYEWSNGLTVVQTILTAVATVIALQLGAGPVVVLGINGVSWMLGCAVRVLFVARHLPGLRVDLRLARRPTLRRITSYSLWLFFLDIATRLFYNADAVLIAAFLPISQVTAYNLGWKPASALGYLSSPLVGVFFPAASELHAHGASADLRRLLVTGTRLAIALTLTGVLALLLLGPQILAVWVGPGHEDALPVLFLLLPVFLVSAAQNPAGVILRGMGRVRALAGVVIVEYAVNLALSAILLPRIGVAGAALGTLVPEVVSDVLIIPALACRALQLPYGAFLRRTWLGPLLATGPVLLILASGAPGFVPPALLAVLPAAGAIALLYAAGFWVLGATPEERALIRQAVLRLRGRRKGGIEHERA